jgi:uncharacterized protein YfeS
LNIEIFLAGLQDLQESILDSEEALIALRDEHIFKKQEELSRLAWDQKLGIDWDKYHPKAREILNDPFFWSATNALSPHGNDTGADLLSAFSRWRQLDSGINSWVFLDELFKSWGMAAEIREVRLKDPLEYSPEDQHYLMVHNQAVIALAFAEIKLYGHCSRKTADEALKCLHRQADPLVRGCLGWPPPSQERYQASEKIKDILTNYSDGS